jgi:hypothetical protein
MHLSYRLVLLTFILISSLTSCSSSKPKRYSYSNSQGRGILRHGKASASASAPTAVKLAINAGNRISGKPYRRGGGHAKLEDRAYDCSGSVSYLLCHAGLLDAPTTSGAFKKYGDRGPGKYITVYAREGHVFMIIDGLRMDTTGGGNERRGPRWSTTPRSLKGFQARHPHGL